MSTVAEDVRQWVCDRCHSPRCTSMHIMTAEYRSTNEDGSRGTLPHNCAVCGKAEGWQIRKCGVHLEPPGESEGTQYPICPHCSTELTEWWDGYLRGEDGYTDEVTCGECEKEYTVTVHVDVTFDSKATP